MALTEWQLTQHHEQPKDSGDFHMTKLTVVIAILLCGFCIHVSARTIDDPITEIPFSFEKGYVIVQAKILGQMPVEMVLATGAEHSTFDGSLIQKYKLSFGYTWDDPKRCNVADCTYTFANVPNIILGDLKTTSLTMRLGSLQNIEKRIGRQVFGMLGADFFKGRVAQFDFDRKLVKFLPKLGTDSATSSKDRIILRMGFYDEYTTLPIAEEVTFDGKRIKTVLDTGTAQVVSLSPAATKQLGQTLPQEKSAPRAGKVTTLHLGDYELTEVPVLFYGKGMGFDRDSKEFGAIAGTGLLQNFITTFDFRNKVIIMEHL